MSHMPTRYLLCPHCRRLFADVKSFDAHLVGSHALGTRHCLHVDSMVVKGLCYDQDEDVWLLHRPENAQEGTSEATESMHSVK